MLVLIEGDSRIFLCLDTLEIAVFEQVPEKGCINITTAGTVRGIRSSSPWSFPQVGMVQ